MRQSWKLIFLSVAVLTIMMTVVISAARITADDEPYFLLFWCVCDGNAGFYRINPDGSDMQRIADAGFYPESTRWSARTPMLSQIKSDGDQSGIYRLRWDGRASQMLLIRPIESIRTVWLPDGDLLVETGDGVQRSMTLERVSMDTRVATPLTALGRVLGSAMKPSPDGQWLAYQSHRSGYLHVLIIPTEGGAERQLTFDPLSDTVIGWSPDGSRILFMRAFAGTSASLYDIRVDGTDMRRLTANRDDWRPERAAYSPDGTWITYSDYTQGQYDIAMISADGGEARPMTVMLEDEYSAAWSPDGRWIAYLQYHRGRGSTSIYRMRPDGSDRQELIEIDDNVQVPSWSAPYELDWQPGIALAVATGMLLMVAASSRRERKLL